MTRLDNVLDKVNSGEGTLGQLLLNPSLYESLDGTARVEVQSLMKDFRANPKKFLTIQLKLFLNSPVRSLIVNADDFGFTRATWNQGIIKAHRNGILTATTLMATGDAFDDAVRLARESPSLDIGCHLVLVGEPFPSTVAQLIQAIALRRICVYDELVMQVRRILDAGITPTHLDTHKHTHLLPQVLDAVTRIADEFRIPWIRKPFDFRSQPGGIGWKNKVMQLRRGSFARAFARHRCRSTDWFTGFRITGAYDAKILVELIRALPEWLRQS